jgi:PAS domain S-box-containing protein
MHIPLSKHLHQRYLHLTAVIALLIGLAISAAQGYRDYRQQIESTSETVNHLLDAARPSAALASYSLDPYLAQRVVDGLTVRSAIYSARLVTDLDDVLAESHVPKGQQNGALQKSLLEFVLGEPYSIRRPLEGALANHKALSLGYLEISVAPAIDGHAFFERAALGLAAILLQTVLLCGALTIAYLRTTSLPLNAVVRSLQAMGRGQGGPGGGIVAPVGHEDNEIGYMVASFNAQIQAAHTQILARQRAELELRQANEDLEARVAERTAYLNHEIAERRAIETALRHSEGRFRDLAEVSSDWFWESDNQGHLIALSERFLQQVGWPSTVFIGHSILSLIRRRMVRVIEPSVTGLRSLFLLTKERVSFELAIRRADGEELRATVAGKRMMSATGVLLGYRGTGHDITRQVEDARKLMFATSEAERANAAKSEFLANMSHELRTPMNAILGFAQLLRLQKQNPLAAAQVQYVNHIVDAGEHLLGLINDVLDLARVEAGHLDLSIESFDMGALLEECVDMLHPLAEQKSITLSLENQVKGAQAVTVHADRVRVKQVVINLVSNAIKYNRPQGSVSVTVGRPPCEPGAGYLRVDVVDNGIGIPQGHLDRIFDPFHRVSAATQAVEGTGVGLAVTRRLIEAMDGIIAVESTVGSGSRFWFALPTEGLAKGGPCRKRPSFKEQAPDAAPLPAPEVPLAVLYVEDNPANQSLMHDLLGTMPRVSVTIVSTCAEAMQAVELQVPDLALLDINLPDGSGDEVARHLRADPKTATLPVVAVSANARTQDIESARQAGFDDYLCKPFDVQDLRRMVRHYQAEKEKRIRAQGQGGAEGSTAP